MFIIIFLVSVVMLHFSTATWLPVLNSPNNWPDRFTPQRYTDGRRLRQAPNGFDLGFNQGFNPGFNPNQGGFGNGFNQNQGFNNGFNQNPGFNQNQGGFGNGFNPNQGGFPQNQGGFNQNQGGFNQNQLGFNPNQGFNQGGFNFPNQPTTQRPAVTTQSTGTTTVAIPGMGTTQTPCENNCLTTSQYNPICGDNMVTYMNPARLRCAQNCGVGKLDDFLEMSKNKVIN